MTLKARIGFAVVWLVSLAFVGLFASAQTQPRPDPGAIISGADIGFRPEGWQGRARTGTWVVRINGEWVEAATAVKRVPATQ